MQIDGHTKLCGLIGNPVAHTLSPLIHNTLAELTGISLVYGSFLVDQGKLAEAVPGAFALHIHGMNVTVPYKSDVIPLLSEIDELAEKIGAVNTLVRTEDGFKGYNTDMPGLYRAMCGDGMEIANREVLILGAGCLFMCIKRRFPCVSFKPHGFQSAGDCTGDCREDRIHADDGDGAFRLSDAAGEELSGDPVHKRRPGAPRS